MRRVEIVVEHYYKNKFMGRKRLKPDDEMVVIGQSKDCGLRLLGDGVNNLHAVIDYQDEEWTISDLGSEQGTWLKKKPIVSHIIQSPSTVSIGQHVLKVFPKVIENHLFLPEDGPSKAKQEKINSIGRVKKFHQVIVRKNSFVVNSHLLEPTKAFIFNDGNGDKTLSPPKDKVWVTNEFGDVTIQQRLVDTGMIEEKGVEKIGGLWDPNLKGPMAVALVVLLILAALIGFMPTAPDNELQELKPQENVYTRMIYDAKAIRKKRVEAKKIRKSIAQNSKSVASPKKSVQRLNPGLSAGKSKPARVISKIRASGLSQLIGKISQRKAKSANFIQATGVTPDKGRSGRAAASVGAISNTTGKTSSYKVAAINTKGSLGGGGTGGFSKVGALSTGNIGNASVGVLEEETEIQGGLDRDVIARIIEKNLGQIRYCYERQLSASPDLYGKVLVKFEIGAAGLVVTQNIGSTTLGSAMVEGCILRRVAGWQFPKPKGGTRVRVTYPFLFKSTN